MSPSDAAARIAAFFAPADPADPAPTALDLSRCGLTELPPALRAAADADPPAAARLTLLNLAHNALITLPPLSFLPNLRILFLLANPIVSPPPALATHPALAMLSFKSNRLAALPPDHLPPRLTWLILTSNALCALPPALPQRISAVRKLMLANNRLDALPPAFAAHMPHLELLRLSNNNLRVFPHQLFTLPRLKWLSLAGNPCTRPALASSAALPPAARVHLDAAYAVDWRAPLGRGASGAAFPAAHRASARRVAVKRAHAAAGSDGAALDEAAVSLAAAGVPGVVYAEAWAEDARGLALVTRLVPGDAAPVAAPPSFDSCTRSVYPHGFALSRGDARRVLDVVQGAVLGLLQRGIAHGDVYAHNVLLGRAGKDGVRPVALGDLGAAWWVPPEAREGARMLEMRALDVFKEEIMARVTE